MAYERNVFHAQRPQSLAMEHHLGPAFLDAKRGQQWRSLFVI